VVPEDERVVNESMAATGVSELAERYVDEPTTYLDIAHQIEVLDLCSRLHEEQGRTLVAVLHDLNHAARYATHLIAMREGKVVAEGAPGEIVTAELVEDVFRPPCRVIEDPESGTPLVVPAARRRAADGRALKAVTR
jgi:iron complex transport system ATP-binding protein